MPVKGKVFTGARAKLTINGVVVGYATSVSIGEAITYEGIKVLGNIEVVEHVPTSYDVQTFTASMFRIVGESVKSKGWFPKVGTSIEEHLENILVSGELSATIEDTKTGDILASVEQVKMQGHNWQTSASGVVGEDVSFVAIRVKDESET